MDYWITKMLHVLLLLISARCQDVFNTLPPSVNTNFSCRGRDTGFYADLETNCRVYHTCDDHGNKFTYYCPAETAFRQEALVCDHAHLVDCAKGRTISVLKNNDEAHQHNTDHRGGQDETGLHANQRSWSADSSLDEARNSGGGSFDIFQSANSNPSYTRSFRITHGPVSQFSTPKSLNRKLPTFVLSSSVFLRNHGNLPRNSPDSQNNRAVTGSSNIFENPSDLSIQNSEKKEDEIFPAKGSTTTFRPFGADFKVNRLFKNPTDSQFVNLGDKNDKMDKFLRSFATTTFKPFITDFKVKSNSADVSKNSRVPSDSNFRHLDAEERRMDRFPVSKSASPSTTTTFRPFGAGLKIKESNDDHSIFAKTKFEYDVVRENDRIMGRRLHFDNEKMNHPKTEDVFQFEDKRRNNNVTSFSEKFGAQGFNKNNDKTKTSRNEQSSFFFDSINFPYSETLRSMQAGNEKPLQPNSSTAKPLISTSSALSVMAGTEFPVHTFTGSLSPLVPNELEDDPYYPKHSTTTEIYYKLSDRDKENNKRSRFSTRRPWPGSLDFVIPEVLPDLNTLDDLVDRRKLFYIPRVKAT